ncbi:MAG: UDP-glucuronate 4-epimerase [Rhodothermales bacterium]|jgi:UDP-glucuronate 4-epimerase
MVLVTGGAGFIGYHLVQRLLADGHSVVSVDNLDDYYDPELKRERLRQIEDAGGWDLRYQFVQMDIADHEALSGLFDRAKPSVVVNLAAQAGARHSIKDPFSYAHSNLTGFLSVLEACRHHPVKHLVYASSSSVYGTEAAVPYSTRERADQPVSLYAATKRANELMAYTYAKLYGVCATGLRFFTVYGPWGRPDMAYFKFADRMLAGEPIQVFNEGKLSRDFTYVDDVIEGVVRVMGHVPDATGAPHALYNIGRGEPVNLLVFIEMLEEALGVKANKEMVPMQPGDVYTTFADTLDLQLAVQYQPEVSLREGIRRFAEWYLEYRDAR